MALRSRKEGEAKYNIATLRAKLIRSRVSFPQPYRRKNWSSKSRLGKLTLASVQGEHAGRSGDLPR
jgi:hypothetical protein